MEKSSSKPRSKLSRRHLSKQPSQTKTSQQESPKISRKLNSQDGALLRVKSDDSTSPARKEDNGINKSVTATDMIQCEDKVSIPDFLLYPCPAGTEIEVTWDWDLSQRRASPKEDKPTKCRTPVNHNKRSSKSNSPLMNNAPLTRRRRLLKNEMKSDSSQFTAELKVIAERLKKAKGVKQSDKGTHKNQTKSVPIASKKFISVPQILTSKPQTRQSAQGCRASESCNAVRTADMAAINITLNGHDDSKKPLRPNFDSSNQSNKELKSTTICRAGPYGAALRMGLLNDNVSEYENSLSLEDDGFIDPNLCTILDTVESNALTDVDRLQCTPPDSSTTRGPQQGQASSPFHCTPEEIEIKRIQALQKLQQHSLSLNASKGDTKPAQPQCSSAPCDGEARRMDRKTSPPQRYTPEEIERKKQEARSKLQLKQKQQSLLRTNKLVHSSNMSLVQHAKNIKYPP
uniref:Uncharacterized protein n=1 Tax=Timema tahoe TaxID=61484 RepID=A0A7R9IEW4_9NEOP|nr:unnamed protein product [Timema tahoe]